MLIEEALTIIGLRVEHFSIAGSEKWFIQKAFKHFAITVIMPSRFMVDAHIKSDRLRMTLTAPLPLKIWAAFVRLP